VVVALLALAAMAFGGWRLQAAREGVAEAPLAVGEIPARVFRPAAGPPGPVVVVAHGFAGSQQMMQAFAVTLARGGYVAVTFDFPGHGRNPVPLAGGLSNDKAAAGALMAALGRVAEAARGLGDGRLGLLGHSMAADIVVRWALAHPEAAATVALSGFGPEVAADRPRNLLLLVGAWEAQFLRDAARRVAGTEAERVTTGRFEEGTARRFALAAGVEHIGILYSRDALAESLAWFDAAFRRMGGGFLDIRGGALALLFGGLLALGWPLSLLLPRAVAGAEGGGMGWGRFWVVALVPAVATPLLLRLVPGRFLPLLLGDYIALHCALYGVLTGLLLWWRGAGWSRAQPGRVAIGAAGVAAYALLGFGAAIDLLLASFLPAGPRAWLVPVMLCGTLPWFLADEWAVRGPGAASFAAPATKLAFLVSLLFAVALDPRRLFFLVIIVPVMLIFLTVYGLVGRWSWRATGTPLPAAIGHALALAWALAATFPLVE
jgi:dienelactone hydrolase